MASQLKQAILDIKTQCLAIPGIMYCAADNGQVAEDSSGHTFSYAKPAILVALHNPVPGVQLLGMGVTVSELEWRIYIVHEQLSAATDGTPGSGMDEDLDVFDLRDLVKASLTGFRPSYCSALQYHAERQDYHHNSIYVYSLSFRCSFTDTKGSPLDAGSTAWATGTLTDYNLNTFTPWLPGATYTASGSAVTLGGLIYLCAATNADATFTPAHWLPIPAWIPSALYTASASYAAFQNHIWQCLTTNTDAVFTAANWQEIV